MAAHERLARRALRLVRARHANVRTVTGPAITVGGPARRPAGAPKGIVASD